jgi:hypothetical protein
LTATTVGVMKHGSTFPANPIFVYLRAREEPGPESDQRRRASPRRSTEGEGREGKGERTRCRCR